MTGKRRVLILGASLTVVTLGAGAAMAAGGADNGSRAQATVQDGRQTAEADDDSYEANDPADSAEDRAEGPDRPITGPDLERATQVALAYIGEGRVTATEIEDEESYYEVEVTRDDGSQIDVQLDESFDVVGLD